MGYNSQGEPWGMKEEGFIYIMVDTYLFKTPKEPINNTFLGHNSVFHSQETLNYFLRCWKKCVLGKFLTKIGQSEGTTDPSTTMGISQYQTFYPLVMMLALIHTQESFNRGLTRIILGQRFPAAVLEPHAYILVFPLL